MELAVERRRGRREKRGDDYCAFDQFCGANQ